MGMKKVLPETGRLKSYSTGPEEEAFTHCNSNKKITAIMTTSGEGGLLGHPSAFAIFALKLELYFSLLFSLRFNFPKGWSHPTYFLPTVTASLESHRIGQAELLLSG